MDRILLLLLAALLAFAPGVEARPGTDAPVAGIGDAWVDRALHDIDQYGARYPEAFADELVRYFDAPPALVADLLGPQRLAPGDVYAGCALAHVAGQPCRAVIAAWRQAGDPGWGVQAKRLGVIPGSASFARLREAIRASYAHWDRPVVADDLAPSVPARHKRP
jgi:hypothetical protein